VVGSEMPSGWAMQALEAQAVAARTFAITGSVSGNGFELYDDTRSQVYGGVGAETPSTDEAVAATRGQIVTYNGQPALTYFFSSSGGHTESVQNVFAGATPEPWLHGVPDRYDDVAGNPNHSWQYGMTLATAAAKLGSLVEGRLRGITVIKRGVSPRIVAAAVIGTGGRRVASGGALARIFGLPDTPASFTTISTATSGGELTGAVYPAPRHGTVAVQAWSGRAWRKLTTAPIRGPGHYTVVLPGAGRFRVTYGQLSGPTVTTTSVSPASVKVSRTARARGDLLSGVLPSWVKVYAGPHAWPTARH
jgi:stage II sporulation protein D